MEKFIDYSPIDPDTMESLKHIAEHHGVLLSQITVVATPVEELEEMDKGYKKLELNENPVHFTEYNLLIYRSALQKRIDENEGARNSRITSMDLVHEHVVLYIGWLVVCKNFPLLRSLSKKENIIGKIAKRILGYLARMHQKYSSPKLSTDLSED